jgi:hypothetical protein
VSAGAARTGADGSAATIVASGAISRPEPTVGREEPTVADLSANGHDDDLPANESSELVANAPGLDLPANATDGELAANTPSLELPANGKRGRPKRSAEEARASKAARAEYMRDLMRRRRARAVIEAAA